MNAAPEIKGWCPGALRPMASGDGLLFRAKVIGSALPAQKARAIAEIACVCGNGLIDLSQRAQLQLRGLSEATLDEALRRLAAVSLLASDAAAESVMNVLASPLAGLDAHASFNANDMASRLTRAIADDKALRALPGKFLFLIDDASALGLAGIAADIRMEALREDGASRVAVIADGARDHAVIVAPDDAIVTALELAHAFLKLREGREFEQRRMRSLVLALGLSPLLREAGLEALPYRSARNAARSQNIFGAHSVRDISFAGVAAPFGRWRARNLAALAELAAREGVGELRLTPWRALLAPARSLAAARRIAGAAGKLGLIVTGDDPRLAIAACPGAPECPQAQGPTRAQLEPLAPLAQALAGEHGVGLHVSGCAKGCAHPSSAPATLIARGEKFDLIDNNSASGAPRLTGLTLDGALHELTARAARDRRETPCPGQ
jgi:precorrin-3B synthase